MSTRSRCSSETPSFETMIYMTMLTSILLGSCREVRMQNMILFVLSELSVGVRPAVTDETGDYRQNAEP